MRKPRLIYQSLQKGDKVSLSELVKMFRKYSVLRYGVDIEQAADEYIIYGFYLKLDPKKTVCIKILFNKTTQSYTILDKGVPEKPINWSKLKKKV